MNRSINIDWRSVAAIGVSTIGIIFAVKMTPDMVERVSIHLVDACKDLAIALTGNC